MDKLISELEGLTRRGLADISSMSVEELSEFMEQRSMLVDTLLREAPTNEQKTAYRTRIQAILSKDPIFINKLNQYKEEASRQVAKVEIGRVQRKAYDQVVDNESYFFDRKK